MKKASSIILTAILLLNAMGYYAIFLGMQYSNDRAMTRSLDADVYDAARTITLKVPVSIPYMPDQADFSRVTGKFEHEGQLYRIVKQRYAQDTLTIICVKDVEHEKIDTLLADYVQTLTDKATDENSSAKIFTKLAKDYVSESFSIRSICNAWSLRVAFSTDMGTLVPSFTASIIHPPERA